MEFFDDEFQFTLELIILSRNKDGATIKEIRDDFYELFGVHFEAIWGYTYWEEHISQLLTNVMLNISTKTLDQGCVVYYMNLEAAIAKLSDECSENIMFVRDYLNINLEKLQADYNEKIRSQSRLTKRSYFLNHHYMSQDDLSLFMKIDQLIRNNAPEKDIEELTFGVILRRRNTRTINSGYESNKSKEKITDDSEFYGHSIIGDEFFLEISNIDLKYRKTMKNRVQCIGQCISGQSIKSAIKNLPHNIKKMRDKVIINLGTLDLMQGRELIDMMRDMSVLVEILLANNIFPIVTTLPPLANHMHKKELEKKRKSFNQFLLRENFAVVDIDQCFLSNFGRIIFDLYQQNPKLVTGSKLPFVLWNNLGRQRVVKMLKRKIPEIYDEYY